jgi:hypothetical protein
MAAADPLQAIRLKVHYTGPFGEHTMLFHGVDGVSQADLVTSVRNVLTVMVGLTWNTTSFDRAEQAIAGSNLFFAVPAWTPITRTSATNPAATDSPSHFAQFGGRSNFDGRRVKYYLFEDAMRDNEDMRFTYADNADVADVVDALAAEEDVIGTITGSQYVPYQYANVGQNDYLTHKARR